MTNTEYKTWSEERAATYASSEKPTIASLRTPEAAAAFAKKYSDRAAS